jgi:hypothetical protein
MGDRHGRGTDSAIRVRLQEIRNRLSSVITGINNVSSGVSNLSLESTQQQVLLTLTNLLAENKLDFEMKSVKDANGDVFQLRGTLDEETGVFVWDYIDADGNVATPATPVEFLNPDGLLSAIETELIDQGLTLDSSLVELQAINTNTDQLETLLTTIDTVLDNSLVQLQAINVNTDQLETLSTDIKNLLTTIDADTGNIATSVAALELCCQATNTLLTTIDAVLDQIQTNTLNTVNELTSANVTLTAVQNELIALNNTAGTLATEATQLLILTELQGINLDTNGLSQEATQLLVLAAINSVVSNTTGLATEVTINSLLTAFNNEDFASQTTLAAILAALGTTLSVNFTNSSIDVTQATHDNLNANVNLQVGDVDVSAANPVPVTYPTGTNSPFYNLYGDVATISVGGQISLSVQNLGSTTIQFNSQDIPPGVSVSWEAEQGKTLTAWNIQPGGPGTSYAVATVS